jgi:hypothetical protein
MGEMVTWCCTQDTLSAFEWSQWRYQCSHNFSQKWVPDKGKMTEVGYYLAQNIQKSAFDGLKGVLMISRCQAWLKVVDRGWGKPDYNYAIFGNYIGVQEPEKILKIWNLTT